MNKSIKIIFADFGARRKPSGGAVGWSAARSAAEGGIPLVTNFDKVGSSEVVKTLQN